MKQIFTIIAASVITSASVSCQNKANADTKEDAVETRVESQAAVSSDTINEKKVEEPKRIHKKITYTSWALKKKDSLKKAFKKKFNDNEKYIIASLNRVDTKCLYRRDSIMVPNEFYDDFLEYSPFPFEVESLNEVNKMVVFSYKIQAFAVYEHGKLQKWGPTNMGKKATPTPTGLFFTNWKGRQVRSSVDDSWVLNWNFNISNKDGVGWHQYSMPGYPASHSCLRLLEDDAKWLYDWADQWVLKNSTTRLLEGTPVIVYGEYDFSTNGIWHKLAQDPEVTTITEEELDEVIKPHLEKIMKEQKKRADYYSEKEKNSAE